MILTSPISNNLSTINPVDCDWVSQRASTSYPLPNTTVSDLCIPTTFILDALILLPITASSNSTTGDNSDTSNLSVDSFYLSNILISVNGIRLGVSYQDDINSSVQFLGYTGFIPKNLKLDHYNRLFKQDALSRTYQVSVANLAFAHVQVSFKIGATESFDVGSITLTKLQGSLSPFCCAKYMLPSATTNLLSKGTSINGLTGDITLTAPAGVILLQDTKTNSINIKLDEVYITDYIKQKNVIKTINNIKPDLSGNISISGLDCIDVSELGTGIITINNPCGKPCCADLLLNNSINLALQMLLYLLLTLKQMFTSMSNNINYIQANLAVLLGSS